MLFKKGATVIGQSHWAGFEPGLSGSRSKHLPVLGTGLAQMCGDGILQAGGTLAVPFLGDKGCLRAPQEPRGHTRGEAVQTGFLQGAQVWRLGVGGKQTVSWERVGLDMQQRSDVFLPPGFCSSSTWEAEEILELG